MSTIIQLAVGEPSGQRADGPALVSIADAGAIAAVAEEVGVAAIRLVDGSASGRTLDPTVVGAYLAGLHGGVGYVAEVPTTCNAPYNAARRVLSLDRATGGRIGVALRAGEGDEVSQATGPEPGATDPTRRWTEYARVLTRLWESFPREALIGDQKAGIVAEDALIKPIDHEGSFYRVAGPLDGPSSVQGRPVVVADLHALGALDATAVAESADVVVVDRERAAGADAALTEALWHVGRSREDVALLGRVEVALDDPAAAAALGDELRAWADEHRLNGFELVPTGGTEAVVTALRTLAPRLADVGAVSSPPTLRAALGLREVAAVLT
ncbi:Flavin-dependent oxidoreductase, luciferase family (includes alkanesulfonate monooxygenase SsuD and methylene tetrahydromethanopterin reductase) [Streptosporangium subroseum]|uniref:Flavin-dependent oxidoreductase, luciferase family (Includes alkanesulfonate monooxygenase SsuD and methylene tetrahydromethanopterin reductase) n=1 Tax=Streptosporangium subroseum TaxID=106412 RepID=A0A239D2C2_9ACTN|nr:LLM class flavin-dependent oxidoreductase [Streptosporangium subroseum]SNS26490.1 Flavin-dependent oxidoreductase, luciferase family (includes alkanesulfonate monooxygenase SsuD and methylene tetrahydromethanopterin reductase) [Streptosporangium subroseum]